MCVIYALIFIKNISKGLKGIVETSNKVSKGQFEYYEGNKTDIYELDVLTNAFNTMVKDIKDLIKSINEKLTLEKKLKEEEMKNLKYENALKEFDLKVLQSQINPHFLFNTLNCINSTAMMENAAITSKLIKSVSILPVQLPRQRLQRPFFDDSSITQCTVDSAGFYCPATTTQLTATNQGSNGTSGAISFSVANANTIFANTSYTAASGLGGTGHRFGHFRLGIPVLLRTHGIHLHRGHQQRRSKRAVLRLLRLSLTRPAWETSADRRG